MSVPVHDGCPVAVEVFDSNTGDPTMLAAQAEKLRQRLHLNRVVLVGDRGMITAARLEADLRPVGLDWFTALRAPDIQAPTQQGGPVQLSLFDNHDMLAFRSRFLAKARNAAMAEITAPNYPGERLVVCRSSPLATEHARKREDLLVATEKDPCVFRSLSCRGRTHLARGAHKRCVLQRKKLFFQSRLT